MPLIVFDLDGTLVDSRLDLAESTNEMLSTYGAPALPVDDVARMVGEGARKLVERALATAGLAPDAAEALGRFFAIYDRRLLIHTRPYEGIREIVEVASREARLAVLTNKPEAPTRRLLDAFELSPFFASVIGGDSRFARKPDPAGLLALMEEAGVGPEDTLLVGDSMIDIQTARRARVPMCVALYGFGKARGDLQLAGDELLAASPSDIRAAISARVRRA